MFTALTDQRHGTVQCGGLLDRTGADLRCGTAETMRRRGHRHITVALLRPRPAEPTAWALLAGEVDRQAGHGVRLTCR